MVPPSPELPQVNPVAPKPQVPQAVPTQQVPSEIAPPPEMNSPHEVQEEEEQLEGVTVVKDVNGKFKLLTYAFN